MKTYQINIQHQTITSFNEKTQNWETCNFIEAGLVDGQGNPLTDEIDIEEALTEREECEVVFE
jgi:ferric iron reductase protein FhuF